ncbi:unnamed protein product [Pleuronectes platessa]|uniref:Uncharacterized protein n=1 Tax=Pleuronectes platessa TaxID=8262 RepID=A0A9N7US87_PLEPL|nr:unnamed protein product [Pleuronectes platessa]
MLRMLSRAGRRSVKKLFITGRVAGSLWRNGIARWTSNPEAPEEAPQRGPNRSPANKTGHRRRNITVTLQSPSALLGIQ